MRFQSAEIWVTRLSVVMLVLTALFTSVTLIPQVAEHFSQLLSFPFIQRSAAQNLPGFGICLILLAPLFRAMAVFSCALKQRDFLTGFASGITSVFLIVALSQLL